MTARPPWQEVVAKTGPVVVFAEAGMIAALRLGVLRHRAGQGDEVCSRRIGVVLLCICVLGLVGCAVDGAAPLVVVFHQEGCPDCAFMQAILDKLATEYPNLTIAYHETSEPGSPELLVLLSQRYGIVPAAVPVVFVGDRVPIVGAGRAQELALREAVETCLRAECPSPMARATGPAIPWRELLIAGSLVVCLLILSLLLPGT